MKAPTASDDVTPKSNLKAPTANMMAAPKTSVSKEAPKVRSMIHSLTFAYGNANHLDRPEVGDVQLLYNLRHEASG